MSIHYQTPTPDPGVMDHDPEGGVIEVQISFDSNAEQFAPYLSCARSMELNLWRGLAVHKGNPLGGQLILGGRWFQNNQTPFWFYSEEAALYYMFRVAAPPSSWPVFYHEQFYQQTDPRLMIVLTRGAGSLGNLMLGRKFESYGRGPRQNVLDR